MWPLLLQIDEWLVANRREIFIGLLRTGVGTGCHVTDHVTDLLWFWFRATRLQLQIKARVNSLWPLLKLFLCDRIVLNWFAVQTRVTRWLQHYQNMCSKQTLKNINEDSKASRPFWLDVFQEIQTRKFPPPFKREKVRQSSYCLSDFPLRIVADWETNIYAEAVFKVRSATPAWLEQAGWEHHI